MSAPDLDPGKIVAVVVDMQNDYVHDDGGLVKALEYDPSRLQEDAEKMAGFLEKWRKRDLPVIHVRTHQSEATNSEVWNDRYPDKDISICEPRSWGAEFYDGLEPSGGEPVVTKHRYSGFEGTDLETILRSNGFETIVVLGALTHVCVEATARDAFHRDYRVMLPEDCCSTTSDYQNLHEASLENLDLFYGTVLESPELLRKLD